jgi:hypothetical protein
MFVAKTGRDFERRIGAVWICVALSGHPQPVMHFGVGAVLSKPGVVC